jgi:cellulose biosynthesis protein BcsQ
MASELSDRGYKTTLISLDRGNSANIYFGIPDMYYDLLDYMIAEDNYRGIIDNCFKKGALNIITGRLGNETPIKTVDFMKLFNFARSKSNIVIIDTWTGLNEITLQAISNSNIDFLVFDSDLMHFHLNKQIIEQLDSDFIAEKTYAIINNCNTLSESYKYIYKQISKLKKGFKNIMPLSSCGSLGCDLMHTGRTPYNTTSDYNSSFKKDMDDILKALNTRSSKYGLMQP